MNFIIIKILISMIIVIIFAEISTRINPVLGGVLSGLPLGAGLSVYFISYKESIPFLVNGIPWAIVALASSILFCLSYFIIGEYFRLNNKLLSITLCSLGGFASFFISGYFINRLKLGLFSAIILFVIIYFINIFITKRIPVVSNYKKQKKTSISTFLLRGLLAGIIISLFTEIASIGGSKWAGILSSFPSTLFALLVVLHFEGDNKIYPAVIYGFSFSISTLAIFYLLCWYLLPILGLNQGFILIYFMSILYLFIISKMKNLLINKKSVY
ncbi:MAG TPA: hypothetical protein DHW70_06905 [Candidatus Atribacteria bacterium]|nr:hypothetical protein [Candidatus Atribacteria bacterium]